MPVIAPQLLRLAESRRHCIPLDVDVAALPHEDACFTAPILLVQIEASSIPLASVSASLNSF
jgi:hypothetical protein